MMRAFRRALKAYMLLAAAMAALMSGCGRDAPVAGGATDTETGGAKAFGRIELPGGAPAACAMVEMRSSGFLKEPLESVPSSKGARRALADGQGLFRFDSVAAGTYRFEARCGDSLSAAFEGTFADTSARLEFPAVALKAPGRVRGRVLYADGVRRPSLVRVYGSSHSAATDTTGAFVLGGMPEGVYDLRVSSLSPFQDSVDVKGVRVKADSGTMAADVILGQRLKQGFEVADGQLRVPGLALGGAVIYDNDRFDNTADDEFLWALASQGRVDLRGQILPGVAAADPDSFRSYHRNSLRELRLARQAGMRNLPEPLPGAFGRLSLPPSGRWEDIQPLPSPGSALIAAEAAKASPDRPLLFLAGGPMTTLASAILSDPSIAERILVFATFNFNRPEEDSLAVFVVAKSCRLVEWGTGYTWDSALARLERPAMPAMTGSRFGEEILSRYAAPASPFAFFGDLSGIAFAYDPKVLRTALAANLPAPGSDPVPAAATAATFDLIAVPAGATDFQAIQAAYFGVVSSAGAYHPWGPGDTIQAEAYSGHAADTAWKVEASGESGAEALPGLASGAWAEYRVRGGSGLHKLELRCRNPSGGHLEVSVGGAAPLRADIAAAPYWNTQSVVIRLSGGLDTLRVTSGADGLDLDWLRLSLP
ncbi:MAG: hypothetical protein JWP91_2049 [Fibrobacteres bacterium]|nr:hypothetical protein [Fibrobacterota bacterium]